MDKRTEVDFVHRLELHRLWSILKLGGASLRMGLQRTATELLMPLVFVFSSEYGAFCLSPPPYRSYIFIKIRVE